ncbi:MAG: peroxidase [Woeseiaceae bacterium]
MSYIKTIAAEQATGAVHDMYRRQQDHWSYVPNYAKSFSHRPEVMARWGRLLAEIRRPLDDYRFELATFAAAALLKHTACSLAHGGKLADMIGTEAVVAIADGQETKVLQPVDAAIVRFARDIARDASDVTAGQVDELRTKFGLSESDIFDIAAAASARCFFTKVLDAVGSEPDEALLDSNRELARHLRG